MDDSVLPKDRPLTDREILLLLDQTVRNTIKEIKTMDSGVTTLHNRIVNVERFKDEVIARNTLNKVDTMYDLTKQIQWSYKTVAIISGGMGFVISVIINYLPGVISFIQHSGR